MVYHILNGDSLAHTFPDAKIKGEMVVVREALIDGDLSGDSLERLLAIQSEVPGSNTN